MSQINCDNILVPTRQSDYGFGSRVNIAIAYAPWAMVHGWGFQFSSEICPYEDRGYPHCFFQPTSTCGTHVEVAGSSSDWRTKHRGRYVSNACEMAAAALGIDGRCTVSSLRRWQVVAQLLMRLQPEASQRIERDILGNDLVASWIDGTFAALHIRRGDKIYEASYQDECKYAKRLARMCLDQCHDLKIFVATDDLNVLHALRDCLPSKRYGWMFNHFSGNPGRGSSRQVHDRLYAEILIMVRANWTVGTFSSNVDRLVQMLRFDKEAGTMQGVDGRWFSGWPPPQHYGGNRRLAMELIMDDFDPLGTSSIITP